MKTTKTGYEVQQRIDGSYVLRINGRLVASTTSTNNHQMDYLRAILNAETNPLYARIAELEEQIALYKPEMDFLARLDTLVSRWHEAHSAKPNNLPRLNEIAEIEERILNICLSERKDK